MQGKAARGISEKAKPSVREMNGCNPAVQGNQAFYADERVGEVLGRPLEELKASEAKYRQLLEDINDGYVVVSLGGKIVFANAKMAEILGYKLKELIGETVLKFCPSEFIPYVAGEIRKRLVQRRRLPERFEATALNGDGNPVPIEVSAKLMDYEGKPAITAVIRDITERKLAEEELRRHARREEALHAIAKTVSQTLDLEEMLDSVVEKVKEAMEADVATISLIDEVAGEAIIKAHRGLSEEFVASVGRMKLDQEEIERVMGWEESFIANDAVLNQANLTRLAAAAQKEGLESSLAVRISARHPFLGSVSVAWRHPHKFTNEDEELLTAIANQIAVGIQNARLFSDVKTHEDELERAYEDIKAAQEYMVRTERQKALAEMAGGVAHDFNNVLSIVLGRAQLALEDVKEPKVKESLQIIEQSARDAGKIVRRLQEFAGATVGEELEVLNLNQVMNSALQMVETRRAESQLRGVEIDISADLGKVATVEGNPAELREVLVNIVFNAMDALPQGGRITVKTAQEDSRVVVSISDTGIGMTEEVKRRIFDPFFTTKGSRGSGLGLSASHGIISKHGGSIEVDSTLGRGSTFYIRLPISNGTRIKARRG